MDDKSMNGLPDSDKQRFDLLVPFFISGDISSEDDRFVKDYLASHPESMDALLFAMQVAETVRHVGSERDEVIATARFERAFRQEHRQSFWARLKESFGAFAMRPWVPALLALFIADNAFLLYKEHAYYKTTVANAGGNIIVATADARFILTPGASLDEFLNIADRHKAIIIYSAKTSAGSEVQVDLDNDVEVLALADELADRGLVKKSETHIAVVDGGRRTWVRRFDVKPSAFARNQFGVAK